MEKSSRTLPTFCVQSLGCKVNQYEAEQIAAALRRRGLVEVADPSVAQLRVVHTCTVTVQAASKSRQTTRRATRLPVLDCSPTRLGDGVPPNGAPQATGAWDLQPDTAGRARVVVTGCWATSDPAEAAAIPGVDAVLTNQDDVRARLWSLVERWMPLESDTSAARPSFAASVALPILADRQAGPQRAFLKIQDGCDAFCSYCIIPRIRPRLSSKSVEDCVIEARRLVEAGHVEIVLSGIFLGAYGQQTAIRKRQRSGATPLAALVEALCTRVPGLGRLRLSSLEPGDMTVELIAVLRSHAQVVPHFHLPLQSGSDLILRRMNRQYRREDYLRMIDRVEGAFDRPAITTDIIVGFPGETDREFAQTLAVVDRARFIHTHAFHFSPRPGTAAARWRGDFVRGPVVNERMRMLTDRARAAGLAFRRQFVGQTVEVLVEKVEHPTHRHGRCERYFDVSFENPAARAGDAVRVRIERADEEHTWGIVL